MPGFSIPLTDVSDDSRGVTGPGDGNRPARTAEIGPDSVITTFKVAGMTCGHCVSAVTQEVSNGVPGVSAVRVDLSTGLVTVSSDRPVDETAVRYAVDEAGYELVSGSLQ